MMKHRSCIGVRGQNYNLNKKVGKLALTYYDGSWKTFVGDRIQKVDNYFQLNPIPEEEVIKYATIHLDDITH